MSEGFVVRYAAAGDEPSVLSILAEAAAFMRERVGVEWSWRDDEIGPRLVEGLLQARELVVASRDNSVVASMALQASDTRFWPDRANDRALYLHKIAVRRAFAGSGATTALVAWAEQEARTRACDRLRLDCAPAPRLCALYERLGFTQLDTRVVSEIRPDFRVARFERII